MSAPFDGREIDRLREGLAGATAGGPRGDCADPERIWAATHGRIARSETHEMLDHSTACPACAEAWRLARQIEHEADGGMALARSSPRTRWVYLAAAAALAAVALSIPWTSLRETREAATFREPDGTTLRSLLTPGAALARSGCELRWSAGPEGTLYNVEVATDGLDVIHRVAGLRDASAIVPAEALAGVAEGGTLLWRVEAYLPSGETVGSPTFVATLGDGNGDAP